MHLAIAGQTFLIGRLSGRPIAVPAVNVDRVVRMAALTRLPNLAPGLAGVLNLHGELLLVVDPHPLLGVPTPPPHPDQHLIVVSAHTRYILLVDRIEQVVTVAAEDMIAVDVPAERAHSPFLLRLNGEVIPGLSPEALDPGPFMHQSGGRIP